MELLETIKTRRSIRQYKTTPVDDGKIEAVLEAARWAPSWKNSQCWRFLVVRDDNIKNQLADALKGSKEGAANLADEAIRTAPVVIVAYAEPGKSGYNRGETATDKGDYWYMFDVALAMQNLMLAAHSLGLATVCVGLFNAKKAADILAIPPEYRVVAMTPLGYPDETPEARPRKELAEIVSYDKYGSV